MNLKLPSSQQRRARYLLISGASKESVERAILEYLGILGWAEASPIFVEHGKEYLILGVERGSLDDVKSALALSKEGIKVKRVSGTLKGLGMKAIKSRKL